MSMQDSSTPLPPPPPAAASRQSGIGLLQVMLILLLVGGALAAGAVLLQSKRAPAQAASQEQTLRWADEAIASFAATRARLPCPADSVHGEENCGSGNVQGWLPLRSLVGASGIAPQIGPVAYMVYRGDESAHLDLTSPGNAYQPPGLDGNPREIVVTEDDDGEPDETREFLAVNGLDLCQALTLAEASAMDLGLAYTRTRAGGALNVAYGIAAAGPDAGSGSRMDDGNAPGGSGFMESPGRDWDQGYDDRVRVRSFDNVAQMLGCRLLADSAPVTPATSGGAAPFMAPAATTAGAGASPYDVSIAAMDILAAAVTIHDTLAGLQDNNVGNTEASVLDAGFAQATAIAAVLLSAGQISDAISTLVTTAASLVRAVATCIASLGATCWEVPLKATALGLSIGSVATNAIALGLNIGAIAPTAMALDKSIKARDRAAEAALPQVEDLQAAIDEMACTLYGKDPPGYTYNPCTPESRVKTEDDPNAIGEDSDKNPIYRQVPVYKRDAQNNLIPMRDEDNRQLFDSNGQPMYEVEYVIDDNPPGLDEKRDDARREWELLVEQTNLLELNRLRPWNDSNIRNRIDGRVGGQSWNRHNGRYRMEVVKCEYVGAGSGDYILQNGSCVSSARDSENNKTGDRNRVVTQEFNWNLAIADAIAQRKLAERWADNNRELNEIDEEIKELDKNYEQWFKSGGILDGMKAERDADCASAGNGELERQKCENAKSGVAYVESCITWVPGGDKDAQGRDILVEGQETRPNASCKLRMDERIQERNNTWTNLQNNRDSLASAYKDGLSPYMTYPDQWFEHVIEETRDAAGRVTGYGWKRSERFERYRPEWVWVPDSDHPDGGRNVWQNPDRRLPYYAPENSTGKGQRLLRTGNLEIHSKKTCDFFNHTGLFGWGNAYSIGFYCQYYPYNRAWDDWQRAKEASDIAWDHYTQLNEQFDRLKAEYDALLAASTEVGSGMDASPVFFGAESALERADLRGSVGPQPDTGGTP